MSATCYSRLVGQESEREKFPVRFSTAISVYKFQGATTLKATIGSNRLTKQAHGHKPGFTSTTGVGLEDAKKNEIQPINEKKFHSKYI